MSNIKIVLGNNRVKKNEEIDEETFEGAMTAALEKAEQVWLSSAVAW